MSNIFVHTFKRYPISSWLAVGGAAFLWKTSFISTVYSTHYATWEQERINEKHNVK
jgi:hypothetical protein